jgi:hypothetical protein
MGEGGKDAADNAFTRIVDCFNIISVSLPFNSLIVPFFLPSYSPLPRVGEGLGVRGLSLNLTRAQALRPYIFLLPYLN